MQDSIIGKEKIIHVQAVGNTAEFLVKEVNLLRETFGENVYTKISGPAGGDSGCTGRR